MAAAASRIAAAGSSPSPLVLEFAQVDGMRVRLGHARPHGRPRGTVLVLPGRAEFIEKYRETLADLTSAGFAVVTLDWRGQGGSDRFIPRRQPDHVTRFEAYLAEWVYLSPLLPLALLLLTGLYLFALPYLSRRRAAGRTDRL